MLLSQEEIEKFSAWLEQDIESSKLLIAQLEKLPAGEIIAKKMRIEMMAEQIVAKKLRGTESFSVSAGPAKT